MLDRDWDYERAHDLARQEDGRWTCPHCRLTWRRKPRTFCAGVPVYRYGQWPEDLYTHTQLRCMKRWPRDREQPDGAYFLRKSPYRRWLYSLADSRPWRVPTPRQVEAIARMRAGLVARYTCQRCGYYDKSHGKSKHVQHVRNGWCDSCWDKYQSVARRKEVCSWARKYLDAPSGFVVIDSETTGLHRGLDEIIELAIVHSSGTVLFNSLIQPENLAERNFLATDIHGITREDLENAPRLPEVWPTIRAVLRHWPRVLVYNASFDHTMLESTALRYGYRVPGAPYGQLWECLMHQCARYGGIWSSYHGGWSYWTLDGISSLLGVERQGDRHRALSDALVALDVVRALAHQDGTLVLESPPEPEPEVDYGDLADCPF
jgi:DNA polymerase III epsilon subunit-like protein